MQRYLLLLLLLPAAGGAQVLPLTTAEVWSADELAEPMAEGEVFAGCSLGCALGWTTRVSSFLASQGANHYDVVRIEDGRAHTAWVEGVDGDGIGERVEFILDEAGLPRGETVPLWGFEVVNGYARDERTWRNNSRVREVLLIVDGRPVRRIVLNDTMQPQHVTFDGVPVGAGSEITLEIRSVYRGDRYADTAISELVPQGAH
jgi:hypothetical protein